MSATVSWMNRMEEKVAFVTGGDSGIGLGIAYALLQTGMQVVITYLTPSHLDGALRTLRPFGDRVQAIRLDVTDRAAVDAAAAETVRVFGAVHLLINNAGVAPTIPLSNATPEDFEWCMNVNVNGVFNGIQAFLPYIRANEQGGQIAATSSMVGGVVVGPFWGVYSTSKFAVMGMMEALRSELAHTKVGVSVICPGAVNTNIGATDRNRPAALSRSGSLTPDQQQLVEKYQATMQTVMASHSTASLLMDPLEVGQRVLQGLRNNDLYITLNPEFRQAIQDRSDALLASLESAERAVPLSRAALANALRNSIYSTTSSH